MRWSLLHIPGSQTMNFNVIFTALPWNDWMSNTAGNETNKVSASQRLGRRHKMDHNELWWEAASINNTGPWSTESLLLQIIEVLCKRCRRARTLTLWMGLWAGPAIIEHSTVVPQRVKNTITTWFNDSVSEQIGWLVLNVSLPQARMTRGRGFSWGIIWIRLVGGGVSWWIINMGGLSLLWVAPGIPR